MLDLKKAFGSDQPQNNFAPQNDLADPLIDNHNSNLTENKFGSGVNPISTQDELSSKWASPSTSNYTPSNTSTDQSQNSTSTAPFFTGIPKPQPEENVLSWAAPNRPFKRRNKQFFTTIGIIVFLVALILFTAQQFLLIAVIVSVAFLAYVLASVPPQEAHYKLTTYGIRIESELYYWEEMGRFWFDEKYSQKMVHIETARFPGRITLMLGELDESSLEEVLKEVLIKEKPADTFFDKSAQWLQDKIPLDIE